MRSLLLNLSQAAWLLAIAVGIGLYSRPAGLIAAGLIGTAVHAVHEHVPAQPEPDEPIL